MIDYTDIDSFFDPVKVAAHVVATGGINEIPAEYMMPRNHAAYVDEFLNPEPEVEILIRKNNINMHDYDRLSVEDVVDPSKFDRSLPSIEALLAKGLVTKSKDARANDAKLLFGEPKSFADYNTSKLRVGGKRGLSVSSKMFNPRAVPRDLMECTGKETVVETRLVNNLDRGSVVRNAFAYLLSRFESKGCLDYGCGECRYCDILQPKYHVDIKKTRRRCDFLSTTYRCDIPITPIIQRNDYKKVVCLNSLTNMSLSEVSSLCELWAEKSVLFVWPTHLNYDEVNPYHVFCNYFVPNRCGYLGDFMDVDYGIGATTMFFHAFSGGPFSTRVLNPSKCFAPYDEVPLDGSPVVSVFVVGIWGGSMVGVRRIESFEGFSMDHFDFLAGGKVHEGEMLYDALQREIKEELHPSFVPQLTWLGYSRQETSRGFVHFYYHRFNKPVFPEAKGTDGILRGETRSIMRGAKLRDDMVVAMRMLYREGILDCSYVSDLEDTWMEVQPHTVVDNGKQLVLYQRDRYIENSLRRHITPIHQFIRGIRLEPAFLEGFYFGAHLSTNRRLEVGDVVVLQRGFGNAISLIYKDGRAYAEFKRLNSFIGAVTQIFADSEDDPDVVPYGPFWREGNVLYFGADKVSLAYFKYVNRVLWWSDKAARLYLEKCNYVQALFNGLPVLDPEFGFPRLKKKKGLVLDYDPLCLDTILGDLNLRVAKGEDFPVGFYEVGTYLVSYQTSEEGGKIWVEWTGPVKKIVKLKAGFRSTRVEVGTG